MAEGIPHTNSSFTSLKGSRQHLFYHCRYCNMTGCGCYFSGTESLMSCLCFPHRAGKAVLDCKPPSLSNTQQHLTLFQHNLGCITSEGI